MSRAMAISKIEQQIEALQPVEQIMMLERIVRRLRQLLLAQPVTSKSRPEFKGVTEKLNQVYGAETSQMDPLLLNAQLFNIVRDEWR